MKFVPNKTKGKEPSTYKTLYLKEVLVKEIEKIANDNKTSFNNVVVSMIETCLNEIIIVIIKEVVYSFKV